MGSTQSVGHLHVHLDTRNFQAGELVQGTIHLKLYATVQAQVLLLLFDGKEHTKFMRDDSEQEFLTSYHLINQRFPLFIFPEGYLLSGDYSFPFAFTLPPSLPGSFHLEEDEAEGYIRYHITATVEGSYTFIESSKVWIHVNQLMTNPIYSVSNDSDSYLQPACCRNKGTVSIKVCFSKNAFVPGETMRLGIEINNSQSQLDVLGYRVTLLRKIRLKSDTRHWMRQEEVGFWNMSLRVPKGEALLGEQSRHQKLLFPKQSSTLGHSPSVHSSYIDCTYSLKVHLNMATGLLCGVDTPEIEQLIIVYPTQLPPHLPPMMPADWAPRVMPTASFAVGAEYNYTPAQTY